MEIKCKLSKGDEPIEQIKECLKIIELMNDHKEITLDFREVDWILPCSALLLSSKVIELSNKGTKFYYFGPNNEKVNSYLNEIGFPFGSELNGETFSPIKHFTYNENVNNEVVKVIEYIEDKIPNKFGGSIPYIIAELSDNIDQHSKFTNASIMAQYYPKKKYVDIGILDNGLTIPLVFEEHNIKFKKDSEAIKKALSGTTTKNEEPARGYGLSSSKKIINNALNGELHIFSRKGNIILTPNTEIEFNDFRDLELKGTLLYMRLYTPKKHLNIYNYLE